MKNWKENYQSKLCTADEAVKNIKSNTRVVTGHAAAEPQELMAALVRNHKLFENVEISHMVPLSTSEYAKPEYRKHFKHNAVFVGGSTRSVVNSEYADFTPSFFYQVPNLFKKDGPLPPDVAMIQVSLPDEHGFCSYGLSVDYTKEATENAKIVIAQINKHMPRVLGNSFIHVDNMTHIVEFDEPVLTLNPPKIGEVEKKIGEYCASLIKDGDTLQLGIGAIPDAVLASLTDKKDLGLHTEMFSDGVVDLVMSGVINNSRKNVNKGKTIVSFLMGTQKLYDYVHNNPSVEIHPVDYVNNPMVIGQNDNIISINSAIQIDLMGQANSESMGTKQFSGTGGQVDFIRGASFSKGGIAILAMPSTAAKGTVSKIVPFLDEGATVTTSRNDIQYVITEYGIAQLKGRTLRERAKALIAIAHPDFREELTKKALEKYKVL